MVRLLQADKKAAVTQITTWFAEEHLIIHLQILKGLGREEKGIQHKNLPSQTRRATNCGDPL